MPLSSNISMVNACLTRAHAMIAWRPGCAHFFFPPGRAKNTSRATANPASFATQMPDSDELMARFGVDVMAAEIEKAYFAALKR